MAYRWYEIGAEYSIEPAPGVRVTDWVIYVQINDSQVYPGPPRGVLVSVRLAE